MVSRGRQLAELAPELFRQSRLGLTEPKRRIELHVHQRYILARYAANISRHNIYIVQIPLFWNVFRQSNDTRWQTALTCFARHKRCDAQIEC